jgi:hypothetical protein
MLKQLERNLNKTVNDEIVEDYSELFQEFVTDYKQLIKFHTEIIQKKMKEDEDYRGNLCLEYCFGFDDLVSSILGSFPEILRDKRKSDVMKRAFTK